MKAFVATDCGLRVHTLWSKNKKKEVKAIHLVDWQNYQSKQEVHSHDIFSERQCFL